MESLRGDIMLLGNTSWRIRRVEAGRVLVEDAKGAPPNVPFWRGEAPARTRELSEQVAELRQKIADMTRRDRLSPAAFETVTPPPPRFAGSKTNAVSTGPARSRRSSTSLRAARCWERFRRKQRSSPNDSSMKAAECSW